MLVAIVPPMEGVYFMIEWKLYKIIPTDPADLIEVCQVRADRLTKKRFDVLLMSMRYEAPSAVVGMLYVNGRSICRVTMFYYYEDGREVRQLAIWRGNTVVYRYSKHEIGERWC